MHCPAPMARLLENLQKITKITENESIANILDPNKVWWKLIKNMKTIPNLLLDFDGEKTQMFHWWRAYRYSVIM